MERKYELKELIEDHDLFEKAVGEYAAETLGSFKRADAINQNADQLAIAAFDHLKVELSGAADAYETMMLPFVKARFLDAFADSVRKWQREGMAGDFFDLRPLLLAVCKLPYLASIDRMQFETYNNQKRIIFKIKVAQE